jgi:hypothetical protein
MTARRTTGIAIAAAYVVTAIITIAVTTHHVRPLFEGFTPPPPYHWVDPPDDFKAGNLQPTPKTDSSDLTPTGSQQISTGTDDAQLTLNIAAGAIPSHGTDTTIEIKIKPLAPKTLGAVPVDLAADGNAYKVSLAYTPSRTAVPPLAEPGNVFLVTPHPASELLFSTDGKSWSQLDIQPTGRSDTIAAAFARSGYYLAAMVPTASTSSGGTSDTGRIVLVAAITVVLALALVFVPQVIRRRRR